MALPRTEVVEGYTNELSTFEELVRTLDDRQATTPTRCEGWTVSDVVAHVAGTLAAVTAGDFDDFGTQAGVDRRVAERRGRSLGELADELETLQKAGSDILATFDDSLWAGPAPRDLAPTLGDGVEALWYDTYVHAEDIRAAVGLPPERGPGLRASVSHLAVLLTQKGWGPATLELDGLEPFPVGDGGPAVKGDPLTFVLAATGRADPALAGLDASVNVYA